MDAEENQTGSLLNLDLMLASSLLMRFISASFDLPATKKKRRNSKLGQSPLGHDQKASAHTTVATLKTCTAVCWHQSGARPLRTPLKSGHLNSVDTYMSTYIRKCDSHTCHPYSLVVPGTVTEYLCTYVTVSIL